MTTCYGSQMVISGQKNHDNILIKNEVVDGKWTTMKDLTILHLHKY